MLQLRNIQFESSSKMFSKQSRKLIRFSHRNSIITSKSICSVVNEATIKWNESLRIPEVYGQDVDFEIYNEHEFGYNPEELQSLLYGSIRMTQGKTIGKFQVYSSADTSKKVGFLVFDIKKLTKRTNNGEPKTTKIVSSILIRNVANSPESGYITVNTGKKNYKSQCVDAIKGEFFYNMMFKNQAYLIKSVDPKDNLNVSFHLPDGKVLGKVFYSFKTDKKVSKADLEDEFEDKKVGQVYFEVDTQQSPNMESSKNESKQLTSQTQQIAQQAQPKPNKSNASSHFRSMSLTRLSNLGESQFLGTSRTKRVSVIHNNGDVVFPSEKRFMNYVDKQTNIISYSKLPSMKFEEEHSKKYYKGASIGVGNKSDFTAYYRYNPGVGQYKLPSIFDRY